jgi:branched-chain amino acid transport system permease protein
VATAAAVPAAVDSYNLSTMRDALLFGVFALSLDFLWGKTGTMSFGHATFFGLGAYGTAVVTIKFGLDPVLSPWLGLVAGLALAGVVAGVVGYFLIFGEVRGPYFTIVTLALTLIAQQIAIGWSEVTGGDSGLIGVPPLSIELPGLSLTFVDTPFYYLVFALATAALLAMWFATRGRYGRILSAIQDNELRARSLGYNTSAHLLVVFAVSAMLAGLAGGVYVTGTGFVAPDMIGLLLSTEVIMWVAVGGRGTLIGSFIGTLLVTRLQQEVSSIDTKLWPLALGGFFIAMVFLFPDGVMSLVRGVRDLRLRWTRRRAAL